MELDELQTRIDGIVKPRGLIAEVRYVDAEPSGVGTGVRRIECLIFNMRENPPLQRSKTESPARVKQVGIAVFDDFAHRAVVELSSA